MQANHHEPFDTLRELGDAWTVRGHGPRLAAVQRGALALRERIASGPAVVCVRTLPIATLAYPTKYAFWAAARSPAPFISMMHRCLLVQFRQKGEIKTLLFNPTDPERSRRTPFFARLIHRYGALQRFLSTTFEPLEVQLAALGVSPAAIDYVAFDHFHTQDLRGLLGTSDGLLRPAFPNAKLLAPAIEWSDWDDLHPMQRAWFVPDGKQGVRTERVIFTHDDLQLGDGVMLVRTPGHTSGNQTLIIKTDRGVWGCSENGVCVDNWSPRASAIAGVRSAAIAGDLDFVLNANTPEGGADQYTSMALEKTLVDKVPGYTDFCQMFSSSEAQAVLFAPGLVPTYQHRHITHGQVVSNGAQGSRGTSHASASP
jgi:glyoxylase-like metal-dependent hydrolase (beta-lactamase superfamily II)